MAESAAATAGSDWVIGTTPVNNNWRSVTYGGGLFVAVATTGTGDRVMTSPDGITWTSQTTPANYAWQSVTYGNGLFVAVANTGTLLNRVMTSPDGITWTSRTTPVNNTWFSVTYGGGVFVAVSGSGTGDRVMTSPDGINWTSRTTPVDNNWQSVTYGGGLFVAVSVSGTGDRVMTSPDGTNWTSRTTPVDNNWFSVTYGGGVFVAVSWNGTGDRVMTSPDGITWTSRTTPVDNNWFSVTYGGGLFVAVSGSGTGDRVMTSPDGITWTSRTTPVDNTWFSVTYGGGVFVAVSGSGTGNQVMTSYTPTVTGVTPSSGLLAGGTSVTLTGTGFTGATGVTFGGTAGTSVTVVSATSITVTSPSHAAGAVDVVVTIPGGTATSTGGFTYAAAPAAIPVPPVATRLWGADQFATSAAISAASFAPGVPVAYIVNGLNFADALSGAPVAGKAGGPVLLVSADAIPAVIQAELTRLKPGRIVVLGGSSVVSDALKAALQRHTSGTVTRLSGGDRFATSAAISAASFAPGVPVAYIVNGLNFADALSGAPVAGKAGGPVLLVSADAIPAVIQAELTRLKPGRIVVLGGVSVVSDSVAQRLASFISK